MAGRWTHVKCKAVDSINGSGKNVSCNYHGDQSLKSKKQFTIQQFEKIRIRQFSIQKINVSSRKKSQILEKKIF